MQQQPLYDQLELFKGALPVRPYCSNDPTDGLMIRTLDHALKRRYIQPNHPNSKLWLVYDVDRPTCVSELTDDLLLPAPHFFVQNPNNQHAHVYYGLETAVHMNPGSSQTALRFAAAVDCALTVQMDSDGQYSGLIAKNPANEHWRTYTINSPSYELGELAEYLDLDKYGDKRRNYPESGLGRNVNLFDRLRRWSYKAIRQGWPDEQQWHRAVFERANMYNVHDNPLPHNEVRHTATSVAKWVFRNFSAQAFSEVQRARGSRKGQSVRDQLLPLALEMNTLGATQKEIAEKLGITQQTISNWLSSLNTKSHIR